MRPLPPVPHFALATPAGVAIFPFAQNAMPSSETQNHTRLKALALRWAQTHGFAICGLEVRVPKSGYRADVAASGRGATARTAVFECKQARADLLKDAHAEAATREVNRAAGVSLPSPDWTSAELPKS